MSAMTIHLIFYLPDILHHIWHSTKVLRYLQVANKDSFKLLGMVFYRTQHCQIC